MWQEYYKDYNFIYLQGCVMFFRAFMRGSNFSLATKDFWNKKMKSYFKKLRQQFCKTYTKWLSSYSC